MLVLVERYLQDQTITVPPLPEWRLGRIRHALEVFARAVDHWHFKREESERGLDVNICGWGY